MSTWIAERFGAYGRRTLIALLALVPVLMLPVTLEIFNLAKLTLMWVLGLAASWLWFCWSRERGSGIPRFNLGFAAAAFLTAYLLATVFSQNRAISLLGLYRRYGGLIPVLVYAGIMFLVVVLFWERPIDIKWLVIAVAAGALPVSLYTVLQEFGLDWISWSTPSGIRPEFPGSTLGNSNFAGGFLAISLPFVAYPGIVNKSWIVRSGVALALGLCVAALWFTGSRGGLIAAAGGLVFMAMAYRDRLPKWSRAGLGALAASGALLAALVLFQPGMDKPPGALAEVEVLRTDTFRLRSYWWAAAWRIFLDNPVLGTGPDTFRENYETYHLALDPETLGPGTPDKPHNIYLEYAANSGLLGLGTLLALAGLALKYGLGRAGNLSFGEQTLLGAFVGGLAAYLIQGFFSMDMPPLALMGWVSIAGVAVLADPRLQSRRASRAASLSKAQRREEEAKQGSTAAIPGGWVRVRTVQATAAVVVLALFAVGIRPLWADIHARSGMLRTTPLPEGLSHLSRAAELNPLGSTYQTMAATRVGRQARQSPGLETQVFRQAHAWLLRAQEGENKSMFALSNLARVNQLWAEGHDPRRYGVADRWWMRAVELDPSDWRLRLKYGLFLGDWALRTEDEAAKRKAVSVLERVSELAPGEPEVWVALGKSYILNRQMAQARIAMTEALRIRPEYPSAQRWLSRISGPAEGSQGSASTRPP